MTDYSQLIDRGRLAAGTFGRSQVEQCLRVADRDIGVAAAIVDTSHEWAYNVMLQAGRALLFHEGYRTTGSDHHATVVRFLELRLAPNLRDLIAVMDRMRRKRNRASFGEASSAFYDENAIQFFDPDHSEDEDRFILLGISFRLRVLVVCHCYRESETVVRIITARRANRSEEQEYWRRRT